ncbi:MAG: DNA repair protein RadC [Patescibacteria group bacterium]|nr:DNA repair protein RadC [Patescibacteria group bacterium]
MEYQVNINYRFFAESLKEAQKMARLYVRHILNPKPMPDSACSPLEIAQRCSDFRKAEKEHFCVFHMDTQNKIINREIVSIGTLNASLIHPRECFKTAIRQNCCSVIFVHNHPSGSLEPSAEDITVTKRLKNAGELLGIEVLDHIIITNESYFSLKEKKLL